MTRSKRFDAGTFGVVLLVIGASFLAPAPFVDALLSADGAGQAVSAARVMPQAAAPSITVAGNTASITWTPTQVSADVNATRYTVRRYTGAGTLLATLTDCATGGAVGCIDSGLGDGDYTYSVQAGHQSWNGPPSTFGNTITVGTAAALTITSATTVSALPTIMAGTIANYTAGSSLSYRLDSPTGMVLSGAPATVTNPTSQSVSITLPAGVTDGAHVVFVVGSAGAQASTSVTVAVPPKLQSMVVQDGNGNGKVDRVVATFDETLAPNTAGITPWALTNVPSGGTLTSVVVSGSQATLTLAEGAGAADTAVGSFTIGLAPTADGIRDTAGNQSSFATTAPTDQARPVAMSITDTNGLVDGRIEPGDRMSVLFSEALAPGTVPNSTTVTLTGGQGNANDVMTLTGVSDVDRDLGGPDYIARAGRKATFASTVILANGNRSVTVVVGLVCTGDCLDIGTQLTAATYSYLPVPTIADQAGNTSTAVRHVGIRLF